MKSKIIWVSHDTSGRMNGACIETDDEIALMSTTKHAKKMPDGSIARTEYGEVMPVIRGDDGAIICNIDGVDVHMENRVESFHGMKALTDFIKAEVVPTGYFRLGMNAARCYFQPNMLSYVMEAKPMIADGRIYFAWTAVDQWVKRSQKEAEA